MRTTGALVLSLLLGAVTLPPAHADDLPTPRVFKGAPMQKGQWRVEMLQMQRSGKAVPGPAGVKDMSMCMDAVTQMGRQNRQPGDQAKCSFKLLKDTPNVAQMESVCDKSTSRSTVTREGPDRFLIEVDGTGHAGEPFAMKARYTYEGPCKAGAGMVTLDKSGPQCKRMRAQMAKMSPDKACRNLTGNQRTMCETQIQRSLAQVAAMCPE